MFRLSDHISDFCSSEHFRFLEATVKPHAEPMLAHWCALVSGDVTIDVLERSLEKTASLDLPLETRRAFPRLLEAFFAWLSSSGQYPPAGEWAPLIPLVEKKYADRFRDDGTVKGETFQKNYTDVGRNDPCPCGSGKKFKKCCMGLIG